MSLQPMNPDAERIYDEQIAPLMAQIIAICKRERIPMLATFQYGSRPEEGEVDFCTTWIPFEGQSPGLSAALRVINASPPVAAFTITTETQK